MYCAAPLGSCEKELGVLDAWGIGERSGVRPSTGWKGPARGTTRSACSFRLQRSPSLYTARTLATRRGSHISPRSLVAARPRVEIRVSRRSLGLSSGSEALLGEAADRFERVQTRSTTASTPRVGRELGPVGRCAAGCRDLASSLCEADPREHGSTHDYRDQPGGRPGARAGARQAVRDDAHGLRAAPRVCFSWADIGGPIASSAVEPSSSRRDRGTSTSVGGSCSRVKREPAMRWFSGGEGSWQRREGRGHVQKYVASTMLREPLPWSNSTLLDGDAADAWPGSRSSWARKSCCSAAASSSSR